MKRIIVLLLMLVMCIGFVSACSSDSPEGVATLPPSPSEPAPPADVTAPVEATPDIPELPAEPAFVDFTDSVDRKVEVPKIVTSVSPSGSVAQMFLLAIAPDLMVTVASEYKEQQIQFVPDYVTKLPVVGAFYGSADINYETIASVNPEIVIDVGEPKGTIVEDMDEIMTTIAIPAVHITATLQSSPEAFRMLGALLGREEKGEQLALFCEKILAQTDGIMAQVGNNKINALYCLGAEGQNVIASTSFHAEVIDYVMNNLAVVDSPASKGSGNETDMEQISVWNPDFVIFGHESVYSKVADDAAWSTLPAIKNGSYIEVPFGPYDWIGNPPSINRYLSMVWLTKVLYPEFASFDLHEQIKEYYGLFYGYDLTTAKYDELTINALVK